MSGLVGREKEKKILLDLLDRIAAGQTAMLLIEGQAGIGKTALVEDFRRGLPADVLFTGGVFDEAAQHLPYSGLRQALLGLLRTMLAQNSGDVAAWRLRLQKALGSHAPIITAFIPEVERLLGPQPLPPEFAPEEQRQRQHDAAKSLIAGLAGGGAPLVIFLDNLQWASQPTLDLLPHLVAHRPGQTLLVIGATRRGAAGTNDAFEDALAQIAGQGVELQRLALAPLPAGSVAALAAERLGDDPARTQALAAWLHRQTGGNPLHVGELLTALIHAGALTRPDGGPDASWRWDAADAALSDDLAALLARRLSGLDPELQAALTTGAHLGASFALDDVSAAQGVEPGAMAVLLAPAVEDGILMALGAAGDAAWVAYRFRHDRIAEAASALTPGGERARLHLQIGRALLRAGPGEGRQVLEATAHLNAAGALIADPAERVRLAELNLAAGRLNRAASAFEAAWENDRGGLELLPAGAWDAHYDLALGLHTEAAIMAPLAGQPVAPLAEAVLAHARSPLDAIEAHRSLILAAAAEGRFDDALHLGNRALAALDEKPLPLNPSRLDLLAGFARTRLLLRGKSVADLRNAPRMTDPHAVAVERILAAMIEALQIQYRGLAIATAVFRIVQRAQIYGRSPISAYGYVIYAATLMEGLGSLDSAIEFGRLALELAEVDGPPWIQNRVRLVWLAMLAHRIQPIEETLDPLLEVSRRALAIGDVTAGIIAGLIYAQHIAAPMSDYRAVLDDLSRLGEGVTWQGFDALRVDYRMELQYLQNLVASSTDPVQLIGDYWDESTIQDRLHGHDNIAFLGSYHTLKAVLAYFYHDYARALEHADAGRPGLRQFANLHAYPSALAIDSLIRLAVAPLAPAGRRRRLLREVAANQRSIAKWARQMPANLEHFFLLVEAERARVLGRTQEAKDLFERTIRLCQERRFTVEEASSSEAYGRMLLNLGDSEGARRRLSRSRDIYHRVGALAKAEQMNRVYVHWLDPMPQADPAQPETSLTGVAAPAPDAAPGPDASSLLQAAAKALAYEVAPDALLGGLMRAILAPLGATRAVLLSRPSNTASFVFEAECAADGVYTLLDARPFDGIETERAPAPARVLNFAGNTAEPVLIADAAVEQPFAGDPYVRARGVRAVLCLPLLRQLTPIGLLYLENDRQPGAFRAADIPLLTLVANQAVLALENARFLDQRDRPVHATPVRESSDAPDGSVDALRGLRRAGDWVGLCAGFDAALACAAGAADPASWRELCLSLSPELAVLPGGLDRLAAVGRASDAFAPSDDIAWRRTHGRQQAIAAWLRGRTAEVIEIGRREEREPQRGDLRLYNLMSLVAAAHTARREYDAARACLDVALVQLPTGGSARDVWLRLAVRRARLFWLLGALPRLEALVLDVERGPDWTPETPLAPALLPALRGILALEQGDLQSAEHCLAESMDAAARQPGAALLVRPDLHLARVHELAGRHEQAAALVDAALTDVRLKGAPGLILVEGTAVIPLLRAAAQRGCEGPAAARVLRLLGVGNVTRRVLAPETGLLLSPREVDVLELLAADASNPAIAERLDVDVITVKSHVTRVLAKLGVRSRYEAAERGKALGLGPANEF